MNTEGQYRGFDAEETPTAKSEREYQQNLPIINEVITLAERMAGAGRTHTSAAELAERLRRPLSEVIRVFGVLGLQPRAWTDTSAYWLSEIIKSGSVAARFNRA